MYQIKKGTFKKFESIIIFTPKNDQQIELIPEFGGLINALYLTTENGTQNILNGHKDDDELLTSPYYKNYWLLPFPNRLQDGNYTFEGKTYQFPINEVGNQNNLHGFIERSKFEIRSTELTTEHAVITMGCAYKADFDYYPFSFDFEVILTLANNGIFNTKIIIKNIGTTHLPFGTGWHPYFKLDGQSVDNLSLKLSKVNLVNCNDRMIPTGTEQIYTDFSTLENINFTRLDTCFRGVDMMEKIIVSLASKKHQLLIWQDAKHYPFVQIYTPNDRESIAIEPMTCNVNAFKNQDGLLILAPNEVVTLDFGITLKAIIKQNLVQ